MQHLEMCLWSHLLHRQGQRNGSSAFESPPWSRALSFHPRTLDTHCTAIIGSVGNLLGLSLHTGPPTPLTSWALLCGGEEGCQAVLHNPNSHAETGVCVTS